VLIIVVVASVGLVYQWASNPALIAQQIASMGAPTATLPPLHRIPTSVLAAASPAPKPCSAKQRDFEMGVGFPQWYAEGYGGGDNEWLLGLPEMRQQTRSCWVEMPVLLYQSSLTSTIIEPGNSTPLVSAFSYGIQLAHLEDLHVFVAALLQVDGPQPWAGAIQFPTYAQEQQWFQSYWQGFKPYIQAAARAGAEQFAIGTEEEWLQEHAPDSLWNGLIENIHSIFPGTLTYDMNWSALPQQPRTWMRNPLLKMVGISAYLPQSPTQERLNQQQITHLWKTTALPELDTFAQRLGRPVFISEIGYRDTADALYSPWKSVSSAPIDRQEQMLACSAALGSLMPDTYIYGIFFWGWSSTGSFDLVGSQAAAAIRSYYQSWQVSLQT
jgi:hypothetical protein